MHYHKPFRWLILVFASCISSFSYAQQTITWDQLTDVKFSKKFSAELGIELLEASFGPSVKALDGKEIIIKGYIIPLDPLGTQYVISRNPMASCFFCGGSGPETVAELRLHPKSIRRYATDEILSFKGKLMLNEKNSESLNYVILNAERI
ncbi:MAG TPA: hypothetical protein VLA46_11695 [Saprospiraceae bacterium]|nr:hypothetical protein [Saprospiraceae bacterium]